MLNKEQKCKSEIEKWIDTVDFLTFYDEIRNRVIGQPDLKIVVSNVYNYLVSIVSDMPINHNMIIAAPSGCGKTETYRALRDYFKQHIPNMPVSITDASQLTETGYKGSDVVEVIKPFEDFSDAMGLCFLDEFDKVLIPSYSGQGMNTHAALQSNLLTMIEGTDFIVKEISRPDMQVSQKTINTSNIMFVGLGSFDCHREKRENDKSPVGFSRDGITISDHYTYITKEDMIDIGASYELLGRFSIILNYQKLEEQYIRRIIDKAIERIANTFECKLNVAEDVINELIQLANGKYGCRVFENSLRYLVVSTYADAMIEFIPNSTLEIFIDTLNSASFSWTPESAEEIEAREKFREMLQIFKNAHNFRKNVKQEENITEGIK